jgi:hypothetical protein
MRMQGYLIALAFLVGFLDVLVFHLYRPRLRNAFLGFLRQKLVFLSCAVPFGLLSAVLYLVVQQLLLQVLNEDIAAGRLAWLGPVLVPLAAQHLAIAWPGRGRFGDSDQRVRYWFPHQSIWGLVGRQIEERHSQNLEQLAAQYASVPWDESSLARIHARIVPHYRDKEAHHRVNPQLLASLRRFREQGDGFAFFYAVLEEFGPQKINRLLRRL